MPGTTRRRKFHDLEIALGAGRLVRAPIWKRQGAGALVVNSGNANAFTGKAGIKTVNAVARAAAKLLKCKPTEIFQASTGVIGEPLDPAPIDRALPATRRFGRRRCWRDAARAIMTTDTFPKLATAGCETRRRARSRINGIAKGSGMIAPDMATMLVFIFTDAALPAPVLQKLLVAQRRAELQLHHRRWRYLDLGHRAPVRHRPAGRRFRADERRPIRGSNPSPRRSMQSLLDLALQVVQDGEGAEKLIEITVTGAERRRGGAPDRRSPSATRRWSRPPLPARTPIGAASSWRSASPARRPTATSSRSRSAACRWPGTACATPAMTRPHIMPHMKGREIAIAVDVGVGKGTGDGVDLRSHAPLYRHQWLLPQLSRRPASFSSPRARWSMPMGGS